MKTTARNFFDVRKISGMPTSDETTNPEMHWILIRGLAREARHWGDFPEKLQSGFKGRARIDTIDLPGAGAFSEMKSPISIPDLAEFVREKFLEIRAKSREAGQSPPEKSYLLAISLGGMIASSWLERWPDDFKACVLINTSFKGFSPFFRRMNPKALRHFFGIVRDHSDALKRERHVLDLVSNRQERRDAVVDMWARIHETRPVSYENFARQLFAAARFQPNLNRPQAPVLVLNSERDRLVHPSCSAEIARQWQAEIRQHLTAGHDLPLDDADWVVAQIVDWLEKL